MHKTRKCKWSANSAAELGEILAYSPATHSPSPSSRYPRTARSAARLPAPKPGETPRFPGLSMSKPYARAVSRTERPQVEPAQSQSASTICIPNLLTVLPVTSNFDFGIPKRDPKRSSTGCGPAQSTGRNRNSCRRHGSGCSGIPPGSSPQKPQKAPKTFPPVDSY